LDVESLVRLGALLEKVSHLLHEFVIIEEDADGSLELFKVILFKKKVVILSL